VEIAQIEQYYRDNYNKFVKRLSFRAGSIWAAEDIVQTAFERAIRYRHSCDPDRFGQWFNLVLQNATRHYFNEENGHTQIPEGMEDVEEGSDGCPHYQEQIMREIYELIETKSVDQIEVLMLHFKYGYSAQDISMVTPHSYAKCHKIISRFRFELRDLYE
jgi:RNA polymerase sigma factor (sigma-70 family)